MGKNLSKMLFLFLRQELKAKNGMSAYLRSPANGVTDVMTILPLGKRGCKLRVKGVRHNRLLEETQSTIVSSSEIGGGIYGDRFPSV